MSSSRTNSPESMFVFNHENPAEIARLTEQLWLFIRTMGGPMAGLPDPKLMQSVLHLFCGPGDWVIDVAYNNPKLDVAGIDVNQTIINYANAKARSQRVPNASFGAMDFTQPLDFSDDTFDVVHSIYLSTSVPRTGWPALLSECMRILRPGGILSLIETDGILTNSACCNQMGAMVSKAMHDVGYGFSPDGATIGILPVLGNLLRQYGYRDIETSGYMIDFSAGMKEWPVMARSLESMTLLGKQMFKEKSEQDLKILEQAAHDFVSELRSEDFCGIVPFFHFRARKPLA